MNTAPERIWLHVIPKGVLRAVYAISDTHDSSGQVSYLRADVAAAALAEAQATIARQQAMLDRAVEDNGGLMIENARLREALREIIDASNNTGIEFASVGMRVAERVEDIARAALATPDP